MKIGQICSLERVGLGAILLIDAFVEDQDASHFQTTRLAQTRHGPVIAPADWPILALDNQIIPVKIGSGLLIIIPVFSGLSHV
jgi:hypothetical protein